MGGDALSNLKYCCIIGFGFSHSFYIVWLARGFYLFFFIWGPFCLNYQYSKLLNPCQLYFCKLLSVFN